MIRIKPHIALATLFLFILGWYVLYTRSIVNALHRDSELMTRIFGIVQEGIQGTEPGVEILALSDLQTEIIQSGLPLVVTGLADTVLMAENLPFDVNLETVDGQRRVMALVRTLDLRHAPIQGASDKVVHFGDTAQLRRLQWVPWLQALGLFLTAMIGFLVVRSQRRSEQEQAWTAMARELAHQLGTPISSLQGWLELMTLPAEERPPSLKEEDVAQGIEEDLERLEHISHRFELVGRDPELQALNLRHVVRDLERYLQARLPRLGSGVVLIVDIPGNLPRIKGNDVLLKWALENVVKNALDALAGLGGEIRIRAREGLPGWVSLRIHDTGPGVPVELRDRIFDPGISGKSRGWGVGLTLTRRIVRGVHKGRISLLDSPESGTTFEVLLPVATD